MNKKLLLKNNINYNINFTNFIYDNKNCANINLHKYIISYNIYLL